MRFRAMVGAVAVLMAAAMVLSCHKNKAPDSVAVPTGPANGSVGSLLTFASSATDPDGDSVAIRFAWGDGDTSGWSELVPSGATATDTHRWAAADTYAVRAQAKDAAGAAAGWSGACIVRIVAAGGGWARTFGGSDDDRGSSVQQTTDGGYVVAARTGSYGAGSLDAWLVKTDADGDTLWTRTYGGADWDWGESVQQTSDGGYIFTGYTLSYGAGESDAWLIKADASGNQTWAKTFGGTSSDYGYSVQQTTEGGYIIAGHTDSYGAGGGDVWLIKTDASGNQSWAKTYGGTGFERGNSLLQATDGGYIIAGYTESYGAGDKDVWLIKTDASGNQAWAKTFGGTDYEDGYSVQQTTDGGYIITGYTCSSGAGESDVWLIKTDASGGQTWTKTYGGANWDMGYSVAQTLDGGYIVSGHTESYGAGWYDVWLIKTDGAGNMAWNKTFGGTDMDYGTAVRPTSDGGYVTTGMTASYGAGGGGDVWLIKTDANGDTLAP